MYGARVFRRLCGNFLTVTTLLVGAAFAGCGARSTISPTERAGAGGQGGHGGSAPKHDAGPSDASPEAGPEAGPDASPEAGLEAGPPDSGPSCLPNGSANICEGPSDCCTNTCNDDGYCGPIMCRDEGYACSVDTDCCKMRCRQSFIVKRCLDCLFALEPCEDGGLACCYGTCIDGMCSAPPCLGDGEPVDKALVDNCCSHFERNGYCSPPTCLHFPAPCVAATDCCSYQCVNGRCDDGKPQTCAPNGGPCLGLSDCCAWNCNDAGTCGASPCAPNGEPCAAASDCCSEDCDPTGTCAVNPCSPDATACTADADCCSGFCILGYCDAQACLSDGLYCTDPSQCCSAVCAPDSANLTTCGGIAVPP